MAPSCRSSANEERTGTASPPEGPRPRALIAPSRHGYVLHDVDAVGRSLGLSRGQRLTDVSAAHPDLETVHADPDAESRALAGLAAWCRRWSPLTRAYGPQAILLDTTGCDHLLGGEREMLADMRRRIARFGFTLRLGLAPTLGAAYALARFGSAREPGIVAHGGALAGDLGALPVEALRIDPASSLLLRRLGLKTVGQVEALPRAALKRRFGRAIKARDPHDDTYDDYVAHFGGAEASGTALGLLQRLDQAFGRLDEPLGPDMPEAPLRILLGLPEPISDAEAVLGLAARLAGRLASRLEEQGKGARLVRLDAYRVEGGRASVAVRTARGTRDPAHVLRLLREKVDGLRTEFGFDALALEAVRVEPLDPSQMQAPCRERGSSETGGDTDLSTLVDRLAARLGSHAVLRPVPFESHVPERAERWVPARDAAGAPGKAWRRDGPPRPERLIDPPEEIRVLHALPEGPPARFVWRRLARTVSHVAGPERIAPEWWRERAHARARDYYRVETEEGQRFWLYREGFHGDERGDQPRWFLHGLFA